MLPLGLVLAQRSSKNLIIPKLVSFHLDLQLFNSTQLRCLVGSGFDPVLHHISQVHNTQLPLLLVGQDLGLLVSPELLEHTCGIQA